MKLSAFDYVPICIECCTWTVPSWLFALLLWVKNVALVLVPTLARRLADELNARHNERATDRGDDWSDTDSSLPSDRMMTHLSCVPASTLTVKLKVKIGKQPFLWREINRIKSVHDWHITDIHLRALERSYNSIRYFWWHFHTLPVFSKALCERKEGKRNQD